MYHDKVGDQLWVVRRVILSVFGGDVEVDQRKIVDP